MSSGDGQGGGDQCSVRCEQLWLGLSDLVQGAFKLRELDGDQTCGLLNRMAFFDGQTWSMRHNHAVYPGLGLCT